MHSRRSRRHAGSPRSHSGSRRCRGRSPRRYLISPATTAPTCTTIPAGGARRAEPPEETAMTIEDTLAKAGLTIPSLEELYRTNASGAHYISHFPVRNLLYLSGTTPRKDGQGYLPGVVGKDLTVAQGYEAARYAALTTLATVKYALGDLERVQQIVHMIGFVNSAPGFSDQPRVINGAADLFVELFGERGKPTRAAIGCQGLGGNASVEIIATVLFTGSDVRPPLARDHFQK